MKTAISMPDDVFDEATRRAAQLGMSRSEFFARAAQRFLLELDAGSVTRQIDAALARSRDARRLGRGGGGRRSSTAVGDRRGMVIEAGGIYWADLGQVVGSRPAKRRPVLVVQSDGYDASRLATVVVAVVTSNTALASLPGNVFVPASAMGLPRDSVVNVTALVTLNKSDLSERVGAAPVAVLADIRRGLRSVLGL